MSFSSPLLNYTESVDINGVKKTKFFSEVNTNFNQGDKVFIVNGIYDNKKIIENYPYSKGADGWTVLEIDGNEIVLDIDYNGELPTRVAEMDNFVKVYGVTDLRQLEYQKAYSKVFSSYINQDPIQETNNVNLDVYYISDLSNPLPQEPINDLNNFKWFYNGNYLYHRAEYIDADTFNYRNLYETSTVVLNEFGFNINEEAEIKGIEIKVIKGMEANITDFSASDVSIKINVPSAGAFSLNKSGGDNWNSVVDGNYEPKETIYGGLTDLWGYNIITAADINDNNFTFNIRAVIDDFDLDFDPNIELRIYQVEITVSYQLNDYLFSQTRSRFTEDDNSVLFVDESVLGSDIFYKEVIVGNTHSVTELSNDITEYFDNGNLEDILPNSNGDILVMEPFTYNGIDFKRGIYYKFENNL